MKAKRIFALLLACTLLLPSVTAFAEQTVVVEDDVWEDSAFLYTEDHQKNPLYSVDSNMPSAREPSVHKKSRLQPAAASVEYTRTEDAAAVIRNHLLERETSFTVQYRYDAGEQAPTGEELIAFNRSLFEQALEHTGVPTEGDYLRWHYRNRNTKINADRIEEDKYIYSVTLNYTMEYWSTAEQEKQVTQTLHSVMDAMQLEKLTDAEKVHRFYEYLCSNVRYDYSGTYPMRYTAYGALINHLSACQGYAILFCRMALENGIDARMVSGFGGGAGHGWNIVRLNGVYYNLDATWDAGKTDYIYFLKNSTDFLQHTRDAMYDTPEFHTTYPIADSSFDYEAYLGTLRQPKPTKIIRLTAKSKGFRVRWKRMGLLNGGYQIQYSTSAKFKSPKTVTVKDEKTDVRTITKRKAKTRYYVRVRSYSLAGGERYFSSWSSVRRVTTKK